MIRGLRSSQLSVQALSRLASVVLFLLASWADPDRLALVALQGALLAVPYALMESLIGRPLSAELVPAGWDVHAWARRAAAVTIGPVALVGLVSAGTALPGASWGDRLLMLTPVLLQIPLEALFWAAARTGTTARANLIPQLTAIGTLVSGGLLALAGLRVDVAAVPGQLAVLAWVLLSGRRERTGGIRPSPLAAVRVGALYCATAAVDLVYTVALPSVAGALAGPAAVVVLRAMDLAFGPFHVALSASTREDVVGGRRARLVTGARMLTVAALAAVSAVILTWPWVRGLLAGDLRDLALSAVAAYCGYKALLMFSTWMSVRHMIWAAPRRYLVSGIGSRVIAFGALAAATAWVDRPAELFPLLLVAEALVVAWFGVRIAGTAKAPAEAVTA
ncbi:hypothetical protein [Actinoplanes teichomyceticus]|uniref:O-antigen/teichoic acid export membrane protein n=1 Tax=Actinoplanes teichomyceticus TaxID=1867 RepID=A0A561WKZ5_ACTTI|nr:hypothetical protein [Actinoplanes teichomyceticus]TWG24529.1 hypothetical protein FHX34_1021089 [Actinoplanes teichomyceticus]GIF16826.1 hypothetical protein Ate01nite_68580 [Actinoplanes teichomyceticus]